MSRNRKRVYPNVTTNGQKQRAAEHKEQYIVTMLQLKAKLECKIHFSLFLFSLSTPGP